MEDWDCFPLSKNLYPCHLAPRSPCTHPDLGAHSRIPQSDTKLEPVVPKSREFDLQGTLHSFHIDLSFWAKYYYHHPWFTKILQYNGLKPKCTVYKNSHYKYYISWEKKNDFWVIWSEKHLLWTANSSTGFDKSPAKRPCIKINGWPIPLPITNLFNYVKADYISPFQFHLKIKQEVLKWGLFCKSWVSSTTKRPSV